MLMQPKRFADQTPDAIALDAIAGRLNGHRKAQTRPAFQVHVRRHAEKPVSEAPTVCIHGVELALAAQALLLRMSELFLRRRDEDQVRELRV